MNVIVVDTSSWISYFRGEEQRELDNALKEGRAYLSPIVAAELMSGDISPAHRSRLASLFVDLSYCDSTLSHWIRVGELRGRLGRKGIAISTPDAHIAQCALDLDAYLLSEDKIFSRLAKVIKLKLI